MRLRVANKDKKMKKVFISHPMNGLSDEQIKENRVLIEQKAIEKLGKVEFIDSFFEGDDLKLPLQFLGESLKLLATADYAIFGEGWENARGCRIEYISAKEYGIEVIK
jgi:hypothetical protein